ncbi:hypothetical protein FXB38_40895 [Bradyrhizobium cytisi]|uniref:Uncharacterized protein n=2 Tax=Bradyrhizobium cytisi TaxID=515489 RepID=A0A5S4VU11_9BRAD|nr:hypothetical protein FXB38_40895 [Bradyrhizobium cytisi]
MTTLPCIVTGLIFGMLWTVPGDPARAFVGVGEVLDRQQLDVIRKEHNVDHPVVVKYALCPASAYTVTSAARYRTVLVWRANWRKGPNSLAVSA